jgi:hypothetical protein
MTTRQNATPGPFWQRIRTTPILIQSHDERARVCVLGERFTRRIAKRRAVRTECMIDAFKADG